METKHHKYISFVHDREQIFVTADSLETIKDFTEIRLYLLRDKNEKASALLKKYLKLEYPEAIYLNRSGSKVTKNREAFFFESVKAAAEREYPPAIYEYGAYLDMGDYFQEDKDLASSLFKKAAELGHAHSQWIYGVELFFGIGRQPHNKELGLTYIKMAAAQKSYQALITLEKLYREGVHLEMNLEEADKYLNLQNDSDIIRFS